LSHSKNATNRMRMGLGWFAHAGESIRSAWAVDW
jgi:hypothetical protein